MREPRDRRREPGGAGLVRALEALRTRSADGEGSCVAACCALALALLYGEDALETFAALQSSLADARGGATFAGAEACLRQRYAVRAAVVSGPLSRMLALSGTAGLVVLGVEPRVLYAGAVPGRHAVLLASSSAARLPPWAEGVLEPAVAEGAASAVLVDPARATSPAQTTFATLAAAFDRAGREALLVCAPARPGVRTAGA